MGSAFSVFMFGLDPLLYCYLNQIPGMVQGCVDDCVAVVAFPDNFSWLHPVSSLTLSLMTFLILTTKLKGALRQNTSPNTAHALVRRIDAKSSFFYLGSLARHYLPPVTKKKVRADKRRKTVQPLASDTQSAIPHASPHAATRTSP